MPEEEKAEKKIDKRVPDCLDKGVRSWIEMRELWFDATAAIVTRTAPEVVGNWPSCYSNDLATGDTLLPYGATISVPSWAADCACRDVLGTIRP